MLDPHGVIKTPLLQETCTRSALSRNNVVMLFFLFVCLGIAAFLSIHGRRTQLVANHEPTTMFLRFTQANIAQQLPRFTRAWQPVQTARRQTFLPTSVHSASRDAFLVAASSDRSQLPDELEEETFYADVSETWVRLSLVDEFSLGSRSALDLGAGSGNSTTVLREIGYTTRIDAVDLRGNAWRKSAPKIDGVVFHELTDEEFLQAHPHSQYDAINIGYGMATAKAEKIGADHLANGGIMVAMIEDGMCIAVYQKLESEGLVQLIKDCNWMEHVPNHSLELARDATASHDDKTFR